MRPSNLAENVTTFFSLFPHLEPEQQFTLEIVTPGQTLPAGLALPTTLRQVVTHHWDIQAVPRRYFFELLSHFTPDELEREKLQEFNTAEGQQDLYDYVNRPRRNILEILHDFRHATPAIPPDYLWDLLPAIKPRSFSIASSPACSPPGRLELLVAVVTYRTVLQQPRRGLCSTWLSRLLCGAQVPVRVRPGTLRLPPAPAPLVMVGPGTGVAPFRSFLMGQTEPRAALLFFGCRNKEADFYFQHEWPGVAELQVVTAFSRDQEDKVNINSEVIEGKSYLYIVLCQVYVQHRMADTAARVCELVLDQGACFAVAGSSKNMPGAVRAALVAAVNSRLQDPDQAELVVLRMEEEGRYQTETWS